MDFSGLAYDPLLDPTNLSTDFSNISRKRSRSTTPTPRPTAGSTGSQAVSPFAAPSVTVSLADRLSDPEQRNAALNQLLQASSTNHALDGEAVLQQLAVIVFETLDWKPHQVDRNEPTFSPWKYPTEEAKAWAEHCQASFSNRVTVMAPEKLRAVEVVLVVLRNLSFAAANARLLAFSPDILAILVGALYQGTFSSSPSNIEDSSMGGNLLAVSALHALVNLAPHLDVTGQKLFCDKLFFTQKKDEGPLVPDPSSFGLAANGVWGFGSLWLAKRLDAKEDVMTDIPKSTLLELTNAVDYVIQVWAIFPALAFILNDPKASRAVLMMAVDLLQEFVNHARVGVVGSVDKEKEKGIPSARAILVDVSTVAVPFLYRTLYSIVFPNQLRLGWLQRYVVDVAHAVSCFDPQSSVNKLFVQPFLSNSRWFSVLDTRPCLAAAR